MEQSLILNDGTVFDGSYAIQSGDRLWVYVYADITMADLFALLNDPEKTKIIMVKRFGDNLSFCEYKTLFCIRIEDEGFISAGLKK